MGNPLCEIDTTGSNPDPPTILDSSSDDEVSTAVKPEPKSKTDSSAVDDVSSKYLATPATRHLIKKHKLDVSLIQPTGKGNRILKGISFLLQRTCSDSLNKELRLSRNIHQHSLQQRRSRLESFRLE